jgi:hypothetical protein
MNALRYLIFGFIFFSFGGCQKEEETIIQDYTESFIVDSPIAGLLSRTSQNPTSIDNILDNSSCFNVQLPVTVIVNGQPISISDEADYQTVQGAIDAFSNDDDIVNFVYPITIRYQNFQTQELQNANDLDDVLDDCGEDDGFDEIDCIALNYPITIFVYDSSNQLANTVTIINNTYLFNFLANLANNVYAAINYPISAVNSNGQTVVINSNNELVNFIEDAIGDCDGNSGGGNSGSTLVQTLVVGSWHISYSEYDGAVDTVYYNGYNFIFNNNETVLAQKNNLITEGDWDISNDNGYQRLSLNFDGSNLHNIETNWRVIEYNETIVRLKKQNSDSTDYLTFVKN